MLEQKQGWREPYERAMDWVFGTARHRPIPVDEPEQPTETREAIRTPLATPATTRSTAFLDGLRGIAALFVLIQHYIGTFDENVHEHGFGENGNYYFAGLPFVRIAFSGGSAAVAVFFVLSGYVLSVSPLRLVRDGKHDAAVLNLFSAVIRRPFRLYIPTLGVTLAVAILMHAPFGLMAEVLWPPPQESLLAELGHWVSESVKFFNPFRTHGSNQAWYPYSLVVWTIPIELKGSMLIYVLTAIYALSDLSLRASLCLLAVSVFTLLQLGYWTMACFISGLILAMLDVDSMDTTFLSRHLTLRAQAALRLLAFVVGYYLLCQPAHAGSPEYSLGTPGWKHLTMLTPRAYDKDQYYRYWHSWGALFLVYSALRLSFVQTFLNTRPLRYLGKVSFMLYLVHLPILAMLGGRVSRMVGVTYPDTAPSWWNNRLWIPKFGPAGPDSRFVASMAIILPICLVVADFGTRTLDMPSVKVGKKVAQKLGLDKGVGHGSREPDLPRQTMNLPLQER